METPFDETVGKGLAGDGEPEPDAAAIVPFSDDSPVFDLSEVMLPRVQLTQGLSKVVTEQQARAGQWYAQGFEPENELTIVPLGFMRRRELRDKETFQLLCHSNDQITGEGEPGGDCASCPFAEWTEGKNGKRVPPACTPMFSYKVYVKEWGVTAMVDFKKTGMAAGKVLNTIIAAHKGRWGTFAVKFGVAQATGNMGTKYYVPKVSPIKGDEVKAIVQEAIDNQF